MTTEQENAFDDWWDFRKNMTTKQKNAFDAWWEGVNISRNKSDAVECAFIAGWDRAKLGQYESAKSEALATIKSQLLREATSSFLDGDDDEARTLRSLANRIVTLEEK